MSSTIDFIRNLLRGTPSSDARGGAGPDVWSLYQMSRGRDSVSPAVLRKLAENAAGK